MTSRRPLRLAGAVAAGAATNVLVGGSPAVGRHSPPKQKVAVCHHGKTISVAPEAVPAHVRHGDTLGPCPIR